MLTDPVITGGSYSWEAQQDFGVSIEDETAMEELEKKLPTTMLVPGESLYSPMENMDISAAGYMDGMLHIQLRMKESLTLDPHGFVYLMNEKGNASILIALFILQSIRNPMTCAWTMTR